MTDLIATADPGRQTLSALLGCVTCFLLLELAKRVRGKERGPARLWWLSGTTFAGTGIWATHLLAMRAQALPMQIGYSATLTVLSWLCGVATAGLALSFAMRDARDARSVAGVGVLLAAALCAMHVASIAAMQLVPDADWSAVPTIASMVFATAFAIALLYAFGRCETVDGLRGTATEAIAIVVLGALFAGLNALSTTAAHVPRFALSFGTSTLSGAPLVDLVTMTVPLVLVCIALSSIGYGIVDKRRNALAGSLEHVAARLNSATDELRQRAMLDPLTGLPNRLLFEDRLAQALLRAERATKSAKGSRDKLAVLFVDVDSFKPINDSFGHTVGDEVIRQVADRLREQARDHDTVARIGADQFLVLMEAATSANDSVALASRILDAVKQPMTVVERRLEVSVSIGIVVYPDHGERTKLLAQADAAMQAAKRAGRGTYALFESHMHRDMADQLDLVNDLRQAIVLNQLELHYQPKIDGRRHLICGVEALLRWEHPQRGSVSPAVFIPIAERFGLINTIGNWVIEEACRQMEEWARVGVQMRVAINLSVHQLREPSIVERIGTALSDHNVKASQLLCEITESVAMQDISATQRTLDELGNIGVYLSIDDFGTGYSSLSYLRQLPARQLKIDRTFINDLDTSDDAKAVVDGVVRLAHALGLRVVAEGVETARQRDILLELNCDELQGYFFARPMSADKLLAWTHGRKPKGSVDFAQSLVHNAIDA